MPSKRTIRRGAAVLSVGLAAAFMTAAPAHADAGACYSAGPQARVGIWGNSTNGAQSVRSAILTRAASWVGLGLTYSPNSTFQNYQTSCSGYVAMAWGLDVSTEGAAGLVPDGYVSWTTKDQLQPGDVLLNDAAGDAGHVVIFDHWTDGSMTSYVGYEFNSSGVSHQTIPYPYWPGYGTFKPAHYNFGDGGVVVNPSPNMFFLDVRLANGSWTPLNALDGYGGALTFQGPEAAIAGMPDGTSQLLGVGNDGNVYHEIRLPNGTWTTFQPIAGVGTPTMQASRIAITGMPDGSSQLLAVGNDGNVYHETRQASGSWTGFAPLNGVGTPTMQAREVAIAGMPDGTSQVVAIGNDGNVYHETRQASGSWTGFAPLNGVGTPTMQASKVAITAMPDGTSQVLAIGSDGNVYHEIRATNGSWSGFQPLAGVGTPTMQAGAVSIVGLPDGTSQVLAIGNDHNVYHEVRAANGSWAGFQPILGYVGATSFAAQRVAIAGLPDGSTQTLVTAH